MIFAFENADFEGSTNTSFGARFCLLPYQVLRIVPVQDALVNIKIPQYIVLAC